VNAFLAKALFDLLVAGHDGGFVSTVPEYGVRPRFVGQLEERLRRGAAPDDQSRAALAQRGFQLTQGLMQPPLRRGAGGPGDFFFRRPNEYRENRSSARRRSVQRGVVGQPQIQTKPNQRGLIAHLLCHA
jgi:hypothetical protein